MTLHLIKLAVGVEREEDMILWRESERARALSAGLPPEMSHVTRMTPKRKEDILGGGSLYWVIRGVILLRQRIVDLRPVTDADGVAKCAIVLDLDMTPTRPQARRAFQGWRYLKPEDAPADARSAGAAGIPPLLRRELAELGLL